MILSNTSKYGVRAVIYLANHIEGNQKIGIKKIAEDLKIPPPFLGKILQILAKKKILTSTKGPHGGFGLAKDPAEISLLDIIRVLEGDDLFEQCLISLNTCSSRCKDNAPCAIHSKFEGIRKEIIEIFETQTLEELKNELESNSHLII